MPGLRSISPLGYQSLLRLSRKLSPPQHGTENALALTDLSARQEGERGTVILEGRGWWSHGPLPPQLNVVPCDQQQGLKLEEIVPDQYPART